MNELDAVNAETLETIEKTLDVIEDAKVVVRNNPILLVGVGLVGLSIGAAAGYKYAKRVLEPKYAEQAQEEIREAKDYYAKLNKAEKYATPEEAAKALIPDDEVEELEEAAVKAQTNYGTYSKGGSVTVAEVERDIDGEGLVTTEVTEETTITSNVFVNNKPIDKDFDYEAAAAERTEEYPYPITEEEFFENQNEFTQLSATWYAGDLILADEEDRTIDDVDGNVGDKNLEKFGYGAPATMLYVRNHKKGVEYEIALSDGKYHVEVLGLDDEDDERPAPRRRRGGDE